MLLLFVQALLGSTAPAAAYRTAPADTLSAHLPDTLQPATADQPDAPAPLDLKPEPLSRRERRERARAAREQERRNREFNNLTQEERDSVFSSQVDSLVAQKADSLASRSDSDTTRNPRAARPFLDDQLSGKNTDSLVYDVRNKRVYVYNEGDVTYQNRNLKADYMQIDMDTKLIYAYGKPDSVDGKWTVTKPEFTEGGTAYQMDTITYNLDTQKAKIKGVATQQGDGWLVGGSVKKMPDNTFNIEHGKYTTCDQTDHPHFYLAMTKAKVIPGKKVVTGPAYLVMEDVPIYFLGIPEGFFPINMGPKSGLLMPTYGEETSKGFFLRDLGYYITLGEYADLALRGGFYTLGSWEASAASRYIKRYKYSGSFNVEFSSVKTGEKGEPDYIKQNNFRVQWTHSQDAKANPGSTFSASVNFATSGHQHQRHPFDADQLVDLLLEELERNPLLALGKHGHLAELAEQVDLGDAAHGGLQRLAILPLQAQGEDRQGPLVREDLDAVYGQDDQLGHHHRVGDLLEKDAREHEERHRAFDPRIGIVQPAQLHQHHAVVQLYREVVLQEAGVRVESDHEPDRHAAL